MFKTENKIMAKKIMKKLVCGVLALASLTACVTTATACETDHPEVQMILSFNGKDYKLNYKLYKKITPKTVEHFLTLVNNNYYNGMCVHNYDMDEDKMYMGGYTVAESASDNDGLTEVDYYDTVEGYENFPKNVWMNQKEENGKEIGVDPTYTLYGEFSKNNFKVTGGNGALNQTFGSLTMYYYDLNVDKEVCTSFNDPSRKDELAWKDYQYNSATSLFYISLSNTLPELSAYCTFAKLKSDSQETLEDLQDALDEYIEDVYGNEEDPNAEFVNEVTVEIVDGNKMNVQIPDQTFYVPNEPIVIKQIKQTKF